MGDFSLIFFLEDGKQSRYIMRMKFLDGHEKRVNEANRASSSPTQSDNLAYQPAPYSTNNIATSDELAVEEDNVGAVSTDYSSRARSVGKAVTLSLITISAATVVTGTVLSNPFAPKLPVISKAEFSLASDAESIDYSFTLEKKGKYDVTLTFSYPKLNGEGELVQWNFAKLGLTEDKAYEGKAGLSEEAYGRTIKILVKGTLSADFGKTLFEKNIKVPLKGE